MPHAGRALLPGLVLSLAAALAGGGAAFQAAPSAEVVLTGRMHHLRLGDAREWDEFPAQAEATALVLAFDASAGPLERTMRLRHRDLKQSWCVRVNGRDVACLPPGDADTISYLAIPPGTLRDGRNELRIASTGTAPDDVLIGPVTIVDRPRAEVTTDATVDVSVHEHAGGDAVPSRITVADEHGALVSPGNMTDATHAVRPGVIYTGTGAVRLRLPAGRYVIYAGRGFEYSVDRVAVDLAKGATASHRLTIRRDVDTSGWAAMDAHVHTATFARHGDATIDERMLTIAGEGIELPVSSEHDTRIDFDARARAAGVRHHFTPLLGTEVTTPALGHFNVFPIPPYGPSIDQRSPGWAALRESIEAAAPRAAIVLNHGRDVHGGFRPLGAGRHIGVAGEDRDGWPLPANAMEVVNSGAVLSEALALPGDWMHLLNRGLTLTPLGSSDSHDVARYIVGQGRTYVRCDDRRPGDIDLARAMDSLRRGQVMVAYGLLTEIDVAGRGPGDLAGARGELAVRIRLQGPGWTRARQVALYVNGTRVREEAIPDGTNAGVKWEATWRMPAPGHDVTVVALATGPGVTAPYWPTARPYQPTSTHFTPYVLGISGAIFVDADGSGTFESAADYARRELAGTTDPRSLAARLARYDGAVATQAASLLRARDPAGFTAAVDAVLQHAPSHVANGLRAYLDAWRSGR
jgi:hypothetical protein